MIYVIKNKHLGIGWDEKSNLFVDKESVLIPSRKECLIYLCGYMDKDKAVDAISSMTKKPNIYFNF